MSNQREQLNEMKEFMAIAEDSDDKPYICVHAKKGKYECHATSSYGAAKKAAEHWKLKSTAGIDAHRAVDETADLFKPDELYTDDEFDQMDAGPECSYCDDEEPLDGVACLNCGSHQFVGEDDAEGKAFIDDYESKTADNNPCMYCDGGDESCEVCHGKDEMFEDEADGMGSYDIIWNDETWKEALPYDQAEKEVKRILQIIDDSALQAHDNNDHLKVKKTAKAGSAMLWTVLDPIDGDTQTILVEPSDMPAGYTGESISLDAIVESILEEFPGQPKDYYDPEDDDVPSFAKGKSAMLKAAGAKDLPMSDFERDHIDSNIEDEELGLRFD